MTAILTVIYDDSVYHLSDRLVSVPNIQNDWTSRPIIPYDSAANKSIIYVGLDCRLVLGYTGPSHIGEKTTDKWLAELIRNGEELPEQFEYRLPFVGQMRCRDLLRLLSDKLPDELTLSVGGYQQTSYGDVPRLWAVYRNLVVNSHEETSAIVIPRDAATVQTYREIQFEVNGVTRSDYVNALVRAMGKVASRNPAVGTDVMVIRVCRGRRRFEIGMHLGGDVEGKESLMYAPLGLFPAVAMAPMRLSSGQSRIAVGPGCGPLSEGPLEDVERDCELILNVNRPPGNYTAFDEHVRRLPPWL